jgi:hypothetical protein
VLNNLSERIRECLQHAEDCARKAAAQSDPNLKDDFLTVERRWLSLARSYEFTERLDDFSDEAKRNVDKLPKAYQCAFLFMRIGVRLRGPAFS